MRWINPQPSDISALSDGDVDGAIAALRSASLRELRDEAFLREEFLPHLGLNGEQLHEFPAELYPWCGKGIRSFQYPVQLARYLAFLADRDIGSYLEIGCRFGGTFIITVEYLRRFTDLARAVAFDIAPQDIMQRYAARTDGVDYKIGDSLAADNVAYFGSRRWDLAFVDGDHSYEGAVSDYRAVKNCSKLIVLHDIVSGACPGVVRAWGEITATAPASRIFAAVDQYQDVRRRTGQTFLGIGVVDWS